jgi:hypothetical protein
MKKFEEYKLRRTNELGQTLSDLKSLYKNLKRDFKDMTLHILEEPEQDTGFTEYVKLTWDNGYQIKININCDSPSAMVQDIVSRTIYE